MSTDFSVFLRVGIAVAGIKMSGDPWPVVAGVVGACGLIGAVTCIIMCKMEDKKTERAQIQQLALVERRQKEKRKANNDDRPQEFEIEDSDFERY